MKRSVAFPMHTTSENSKRSINPKAQLANMQRTKRERSQMALFLASLPKPPHYLDAPGPGLPPPANRIRVTLTRISAGQLDDDNLRGALKAVRDGTADWLRLKDNDERVTWVYLQQGCPLKTFGVRVEVEDLLEGEDVVRILGAFPDRLGTPSARGSALPAPLRKPKPKAEQRSLWSRPCFALLPWNEEGVATELRIDGEPPEVVRMQVPTRALTSGRCRLRPGSVVALERTDVEDEEMGRIWLYQPEART